MEAGAYTSPFWASQLPGAPNFSLTRLDGILMTPLNLLNLLIRLPLAPTVPHGPGSSVSMGRGPKSLGSTKALLTLVNMPSLCSFPLSDYWFPWAILEESDN